MEQARGAWDAALCNGHATELVRPSIQTALTLATSLHNVRSTIMGSHRPGGKG
jgi:hypothetical protein